jgi:hypothetical protein
MTRFPRLNVPLIALPLTLLLLVVLAQYVR